MKSHLIGIVALGMWVVAACIYGVVLVGTPVDQKLLTYDQKRLSDFTMLKYRIEDSYRVNKTVPDSLASLDDVSRYNTDPETKKAYEYKKLSATTWEFCAIFSTNSKETDKKLRVSEPTYADSSTKTHMKGHDCIKDSVASYIIGTTTATYYPSITPTSSGSSQQSATTSARLMTLKKIGQCNWNVYMKLTGLDTTHPLTVRSEGTKTYCDTKKSESYFWVGEANQQSSIASYNQIDYGTYTYTFTDINGKTASATFTYDETTPDKYEP